MDGLIPQQERPGQSWDEEQPSAQGLKMGYTKIIWKVQKMR